MRFPAALAALSLAAASPVAAQTAAEHVAAGDSAHNTLHPDAALRHYQAALALDSTIYEAWWKAARSQVDVAKQILGTGKANEQRRDSLYADAHRHAEGAVRANPDGAEGHFTVALALGQRSLTKGSKERVRYARAIFDEATRAVELDSAHDGAHHILGVWHAEVRRLSGIQRFFAKTLFGGGFMTQANWGGAVRHLERAVALNPRFIHHRLALAEVYADLGRYTLAREQLLAIPSLAILDVLDPLYKEDAILLLDEIKDERDGT